MYIFKPNSVGAITSVSNSDGTLTISPTTGLVVASLALGHANTWTGLQTFNNGATTNPIFVGQDNGTTVFTIADQTGTVVNGWTFTPAISGSNPTFAATGTDSTITLDIDAKGAKPIRLNVASGTGAVVIGAGALASGVSTVNPALHISGDGANNYIASFKNTRSAAGQNYGPIIVAGSNSSDASLRVFDKTQTNAYLNIIGDGTVGWYSKFVTYNNITTAGLGVPALYGLDSRTGLTGADGGATTLYTTTAANQIYRVSADIFATAAVTGTATYTITWTENSTTQTMTVTATAINTLGTASNIIRPDNSTAITSQLTGTFTGTFTVVGLVERLV